MRDGVMNENMVDKGVKFVDGKSQRSAQGKRS